MSGLNYTFGVRVEGTQYSGELTLGEVSEIEGALGASIPTCDYFRGQTMLMFAWVLMRRGNPKIRLDGLEGIAGSAFEWTTILGEDVEEDAEAEPGDPPTEASALTAVDATTESETSGNPAS